MALRSRLETAFAADERRYPLAVGVPAGLLTVVLSSRVPDLDGLPLFVACLLVGYLFTSPTVPTSRVGFRTGVISILPWTLGFFVDVLQWIPTGDSPTWFQAAAGFMALGAMAVALALAGVLGVLLAAIGAWLGDHLGNRQSRAVGN